MNAEKMFEELGFSKTELRPIFIVYSKHHNVREIKIIQFDLKDKTFEGLITDNNIPFVPEKPCEFNLNELKAINKQIEELEGNNEN